MSCARDRYRVKPTPSQCQRLSTFAFALCFRGAKVIAAERTSTGFSIRYAPRGAKLGEEVSTAAPALLLATGSSSHHLAKELGHLVTPLVPSLFSFRLKEGNMLDATLAGVSVMDSELELELPPPSSAPEHATIASGVAKKRIKARGALLVTHRGLSGPAALKLSSFAARTLHKTKHNGVLRLNFLPDLSAADVSNQLSSFRAQPDVKAKQVGTTNPFGLPRRLWTVVVRGAPAGRDAANEGNAAFVDEKKVYSQLSNADVAAIASRLCSMRLAFSGKDSNKKEFVTAGGVSWAGVDPKRLASRSVPGLFFAGELLDVDGITGGHNFQSCWSTGHVAGSAAAEESLAAVSG